MSLPETFISCDWGTTNFRLRLVETVSLKVLKEYTSTQGVKELYQMYSSQNELDKSTFYVEFLKEKLKNISDSNEKKIIVASGMVSSSMGMMELDYFSLPFSMNGKEISSKLISISQDLSILLISGVKQADDVMRGEEVQAIGLSQYLEDIFQGILILPGTHSKHLFFKEKSFQKLDTFMTGELFSILSRHSILSNSIQAGSFGINEKKAFQEGVQKSLTEGISKNLFKVRAKDLLNHKDKIESYYFLSGLLIGDELSYLKQSDNKICIAATGKLNELYQLALKEIISQKSQLIFFEESVLEKALLSGQLKILEQQYECV